MVKLTIETPEVFEPLLQPSRYKGAYGGRGAAKSHFFAELLVEGCVMRPGTDVACVREVQKTLRDSVKKLIEIKIKTLNVGSMFRVLVDRIETPGGGSIVFQGMQDHTADSIKSLEDFNIAWVEEAQTLSDRSLELLRPTIRTENSEIWFSWNPRSASDPVDKFLRGMTPKHNAIVVKSNYCDNPWFNQVLEDERLDDHENKPDRYAHIWLGEYEPQAVGAIWTRQVLHDNRRSEMPCERSRTLVGVDPAVSDTETSNEHGITVGALGADKRGYLLEDGSMHGSPHQWATRAVALYDKWDADAVVIEKNQGGDMCRFTLETVRPNLPIIEVHATRGKHVRAEPISSLYTLGKISHIGTFPKLESQYCLFTSSGYEGEDSPDRAESVIWLFTELFPDLTQEKRKPKKTYHAEAGGWLA